MDYINDNCGRYLLYFTDVNTYFYDFYRQYGLCDIIKYGSLDLVKYTIHRYDVCVELSSNNTDVIKFLVSLGLGNIEEGIIYSIKQGHVNITDYLYFLIESKQKYVELAIIYNHIDVVKILANRTHCTNRVIDKAAEYGRLGILKYLRSTTGRLSRHGIDKAALNGHIREVRYLISICDKCTTNAIDNATRNRHYDILEYLFKIGAKYDDNAIRKAIKLDDVKSMRLYFKYTNVNMVTCREAIRNNKLSIIRFLVSLGWIYDSYDATLCFRCGHVRLLTYFAAIGIKYNKKEILIGKLY